MRRAIVLVLDGCGAGVAPDAPDFGDHDTPNTLLHVWEAVGGFAAPHLAATGFLRAAGIPVGVPPPAGFVAQWGRLRPRSRGGKDSVTGHWELMGIELETAFPTYPEGFPPEVITPFVAAIGRDVLGNRAASGTAIIDELGEAHLATGRPIVYTSADSVFQIAAHEETVPVATLYAWCETARGLLSPPHAVQRVIARPFLGKPGAFARTDRRRDYPLPPPPNLVDEVGDVLGIGVVAELFGGRGFRPGPRTQSNPEHATALRAALDSDARLIFANFEDFDMLYGHRNDPTGFARCLEEFDLTLADLLPRLGPHDILILTADHGNDPTTPSTDHSREYVPVAALRRGDEASEFLGDQDGFAWVARAVRAWLSL